MKIRFWGVQGSTPNPLTTAHLQAKIKEVLRRAQGRPFQTERDFQNFFEELPFPLTHTTGGNTTCFEILSERGARLIVDMGSGARKLGLNMMAGEVADGKATIPILMTHFHLDHLLGFPFFRPAYVPGNKVKFYAGHNYMKAALTGITHPYYFPVRLQEMDAEITFEYLNEGRRFSIGDFQVACKRLHHPGDSFAYRITEGDKSRVIATDAEYKELDAESLQPYVEFYRNANLLVFDAQYTLKDVFQKMDWGHSSSFIGVDISLLANVSKLVLTHHDPSYNDEKMTDILEKTEAFKREALKQSREKLPAARLDVMMAYEGLELSV
ncbi:MAG: MBL fold metallo-hydrolase [candidate division KSB1 bacterium]|nr:MBL fold metallo-hydrolase [candidate division KSB1 bacterium]